MKKEIGGIVLSALIGTSVALKDKVNKFIAEGKIKQEYLISQYILGERINNRQLLSYVKRYDLEGKILEEFYYLLPMNMKHPLGTSVPIIDRPSWYYFDGKWYKDDKMDGLNGNEVEQKNGNL